MTIQFRAVCPCGVECWWQAMFIGSAIPGAQQVHYRIECGSCTERPTNVESSCDNGQ